jgi:ribosome maturation factor RimP
MGWKKWEGKKVFIILKNKRTYQGSVINVDESSPPLIFITIKDKFSKEVTFVQSEVEVMQEEG